MGFVFDAVGRPTEPMEFRYRWQDAVLYALGVGAKADELAYLYEGLGPKVLPSFAVLPAFAPVWRAVEATNGPIDKIVHGTQRVVLHAPFPSEGTLRTTATIEGIYDLKKMAQMIIKTRTEDAKTGTHLCDTEWGVLFLGEGGFGGGMRPEALREKDGGASPDRAPDFTIEDTTTPEQALLYRLSGDLNPLHADPAFPLVAERFGGKPILHGLATFGYLTRAVLRGGCAGEPERIRVLSARFSKPVWPGETLLTDGWKEEGRIVARVRSKEKNEPVLTHCAILLR